MTKENFFGSLFQTNKQDLSQDVPKQEELAQVGRVVPDGSRCVQCGICSYNCPMGIQIRDYAHRGLPVDDFRCLACGNCIDVCPRGTLRWETQAHSLILDRFLMTSAGADIEMEDEAY